jgi:ppGpp synthetase/RelA/SpoT-type nucleotidyltranferase
MLTLSDPNAFAAWSDLSTCGVFSRSTETWFRSSQNNILAEMQEMEFLSDLPSHLEIIGQEYQSNFGCQLFSLERDPAIKWKKKSFSSFLEKLYRINYVDNKNFPAPPEGGWVNLERSCEIVDDIVRTTIVVAYADAPDYVGERLSAIAKSLGIDCYWRDHAKEKGYYAFHLYLKVPVPVASTLGSTDYLDMRVPVEIQITTELQGALREVTHLLYEEERLLGGLEDNWKKKFDSNRFRAAYMAHSLRFIEAMIVDLREKVGRGSQV